MATLTISASDFQDRVGEALDRSLSQPVLITKHGRPRNVVLSYDEYERLSARDRRAVKAADLTDGRLAAQLQLPLGRRTPARRRGGDQEPALRAGRGDAPRRRPHRRDRGAGNAQPAGRSRDGDRDPGRDQGASRA